MIRKLRPRLADEVCLGHVREHKRVGQAETMNLAWTVKHTVAGLVSLEIAHQISVEAVGLC